MNMCTCFGRGAQVWFGQCSIVWFLFLLVMVPPNHPGGTLNIYLCWAEVSPLLRTKNESMNNARPAIVVSSTYWRLYMYIRETKSNLSTFLCSGKWTEKFRSRYAFIYNRQNLSDSSVCVEWWSDGLFNLTHIHVATLVQVVEKERDTACFRTALENCIFIYRKMGCFFTTEKWLSFK